MNFQKLRFEDLPQIRAYLDAAGKLCCDYALSNLFAWSAYYRTEWSLSEGFLVFRFFIDGSEKRAYLEPLGEGDAENVLKQIRDDAKSRGGPLRFFSLSEEFAEKYKNSPAMQGLCFYKDRNYGNYVYTRERLALLSGRKLHSKRNHIAQFERKYPDFHSKILSPESDCPALKKLLDIWTNSLSQSTTTVLEERRMIENCLCHYDALKLFGILLFVGKEPVAFTFGSKINGETFCTHVEKADTRYEGAYAKINQLLAKALPEDIRLINREEDMGIPELRKAKLSYYPEKITEEIFARDTTSEEAKVWELWKRAFPGDDDAFLSSFIYPYSNEKTRMCLYQGEKLASMLHLFDFKSDWGKVSYIYGLATDPDFRGKGLASELIKKALRRASDCGSVAVWAIQANKEFQSWQRNLDFGGAEVEPLAFETEDGFFFGEDPATDFGIFRIVRVQAYLELFAGEHPERAETILVRDDLLPENSGLYRIENGQASRAELSPSTDRAASPSEILRRFPLSGGHQLKWIRG